MTLLQRIVIPPNYRADVEAYAMESWFESKKSCPKREEMLKLVDTFYEGMTTVDTESEGPNIRASDSAQRETIAIMLGLIIRRDNSLADHISTNSTLPSDINRWYAICTAAAWLVIQVRVRDLVRSQRGGE